MSGVATVKGIGYQQAQALVAALSLLDDPTLGFVRVEGLDDIVDIEIRRTDGTLARAIQAKTRQAPYKWGRTALLEQLRRWRGSASSDASFTFMTDGELGRGAVELQQALEQARAGDLRGLQRLVEPTATAEELAGMAAASIVVDVTGVSAALLQAQRQVASLLDGHPADALDRAEVVVGRLFAELFERGGKPAAASRVLTRAEIAAVLGLPLDQPLQTRWPGEIRDALLDDAGPERTVITPYVLDDSETVEGHERSISTLITGRTTTLLWGRTGSGKTTIARCLTAVAAEERQAVLVARAEGYAAGQLPRLVADALAAVVGVELPTATGRQFLTDSSTVLVLDGVTEIPPDLQTALRRDLRTQLAARGSRLVLVGRDAAALRHLLPPQADRTSYRPRDFDYTDRRDLARSAVGRDITLTEDEAARAAEVLAARVEEALGDAAGNPLLLQLGIDAVLEGIEFSTPGALYEAMIDRIAERGGGVELLSVTLALGIVFAALIDEGRRYLNSLEWAEQAGYACQQLTGRGLTLTVEQLTEVAIEVGLLNRVKQAQLLVPMHDSVADYLAALAHAQLGIALPTKLTSVDDQRIRFLVEAAGIDPELGLQIAADRPFLAPHLLAFDTDAPDATSAEEVQELLEALVPVAPIELHVDAAAEKPRVCATFAVTIFPATDDRARPVTFTVVLDHGGAFTAAVRIWRLVLQQKLRKPQDFAPVPPQHCDEIVEAITNHLRVRRDGVGQLMRLFTAGQRSELADLLPPLGLTVLVLPEEGDALLRHRPVRYRESTEIRVTCTDVHRQDERWGATVLEHLLSETAAADAVNVLIRGLERAAPKNWTW